MINVSITASTANVQAIYLRWTQNWIIDALCGHCQALPATGYGKCWNLINEYDGDEVYSIAAYNAGAAAVDRWRKNLKGLKKDEFIESIPYQETRDYVKKVYASAAIYRQLYGLR